MKGVASGGELWYYHSMKTTELTTEEVLSAFGQRLLPWFYQAARDLPWRHTDDPYAIWVSEIMLQQTRVAAVLGYYDRFLAAFPTVEALAEAPEERLMKLWEGLGYYSRARNLQRCAKMVSGELGGRFPETYEGLLKLPGVGDYTAAAVASAAFGQRCPAVDGNVYRVLTRLTDCPDSIGDTAVKRRIRDWAEFAMPQDKRGIRLYNQATMDLGATVCIPVGAPRCDVCPMAEVCLARLRGTAENRPVKAPKKPRKVEERTVFVLLRGEETALRKRGARGLLAGLWEFPNVAGKLTEAQVTEALGLWGLTVKDWRQRLTAQHIFTHVEWDMLCYVLEVEGDGPDLTWLDRAGFAQAALPSAFRRCTEALRERWEGQ